MKRSTGTYVNRPLASCDVITPLFQPFVLDLLDKMLCIFEVVERLTNQWFDDVSQFFYHPICYGPATGTIDLRGMLTLCLYEFVFKFGGGVFVEDPVGVGVCQK